MKKWLIIIFIPIISACSSSALTLVNTLASFGDYQLTKDQSYAKHPLNQLDIYRPTNQAIKGTVIFFYGGCWGACTTYTREYYRFVGEALTSIGYIAVIPDYRRYPEVLFPQIMLDSSAVVAWVNDNIEQYGGETEQIFLMGHSAGGHIAAMLTVNKNYLDDDLHQNIRGFIGLSAPYDFIFDKPYQTKLFSGLEYSESQPSYFVTGKEPPLLLLYGNDDKIVYPRNIIKMSLAVKQKGGTVETHTYNEIDHVGILSALSIPYRKRLNVMSDINHFLQSH